MPSARLQTSFWCHGLARFRPVKRCALLRGGRNAVYLAEQGFEVKAQDFSAEGLRLAQELAAQRGVTLTCLRLDLSGLDPPPSSVDLVVAIWMHLPPPLRSTVFRRTAWALRQGGDIIVVAYTPRQLQCRTGGPSTGSWLLEPDQLKRDFAGFDTLVLEEFETVLDEGTAHQGVSSVVQFHARKSR